MQAKISRALALLAPLTCSFAVAQQDSFPLPASAPTTTPAAPFILPRGTTQTVVTDLATLNTQGLSFSVSNWDMICLDPSGRYVFIPAETSRNAGIVRVDLQTGQHSTLMLGDGTGSRESDPNLFDPTTDDFTRFDPCTFTPHGTVITGEESTGGRFFEILNPLDTTGNYQVVWRTSIPAVAHEGLRFDAAGNLYFVDESNTGSIYKFVPQTPGDLSVGQSFVLVVDGFVGNPAANWNDASNRGTTRTGTASWVPMTDPVGNPLTTTDPFVYVTTTSGRTAADELNGTPYGRPEDLEIGYLANGNEVLYVALTSENVVLSIELSAGANCTVREFANYDTVDLATGVDVNPAQNASDPYSGSGAFDNPDNLAIDAFGSIYLIEDNNPGDIWKCVDADNDGVAESMGRFVSLGIPGSEPTGLIADPNDPWRLWVCVQHPSDGNDSLVALDTRPMPGASVDLTLRTGVNRQVPNALPAEFVKDSGAGDSITLSMRSDGGTLDFSIYLLLMQSRQTSLGLPSAVIPTVWLDLFQPIFVIDGGVSQTGLVEVLSPNGASVSFKIPPGLLGLSLISQGVALTSSGTLAFTDGHEFVIR